MLDILLIGFLIAVIIKLSFKLKRYKEMNDYIECTNCGHEYNITKHNYCPKCGYVEEPPSDSIDERLKDGFINNDE